MVDPRRIIYVALIISAALCACTRISTTSQPHSEKLHGIAPTPASVFNWNNWQWSIE